MPRHARIHYPGGIYYLISRFVNGSYLIKTDEDRTQYLRLLGNASNKTDALILSYCLMSNHIHLVVRAGRDSLEGLMKSVNAGFAGWINNRSKRRKGPVFAGRYKSILVDEEAYLLELVRYVHNNPVRAKVASHARDISWSGHQAYVGDVTPPEWLNIGYVLSMFGKQHAANVRKFEAFVREGEGEGRRRDLNGEPGEKVARKFQEAFGDAWRVSGPIAGDQAFVAKVLADISSVDEQVAYHGHVHGGEPVRPGLEEVIAVVCAEVGVEPWVFDHQPRKRTAVLARRLITLLWIKEYGGMQTEIGKKLKTSSGTVSGWYSKAVENLPDYEPMIDRIKEQLPTDFDDVGSPRRICFSFDISE
jgi:putative transposase